MKLEEYDKKRDLRETITQYERTLRKLDELKKGGDARMLGVGVVRLGFTLSTFYECVKDEKLFELFKNLLKERRDELIKEFENE